MAAQHLSEQRPVTQIPDPSGFTSEERELFEQDDVNAGRTIAKILSTLFIYTVLAMLAVGWWTMAVVGF